MADWVTISALATAGGTLVLAGTTYASVRSANRAARVAETSLLAGQRPLLVQSRADDPSLRARFVDGVGVTVPGEGAGVEVVDGRVYLGLSLRNVGPGIAVLHGGYVHRERQFASVDHPPLEDFHRLTRDLFIAPGETGYWQIAFRDDDPEREGVLAAVESGRFSVDILYGDYQGGQRVVTRFALLRENEAWKLAVVRHWQIDNAAPR